MKPIRKSEILRYLGYRKDMEINEHTDELIDQCIDELKKVINPQFVYKRFPVKRVDDTILIEGMSINSKALSKNLEGCNEVYLFAATVGIGVDQMIRRVEITNMAKAAIYQATGAEMVECVCDDLNDKLKEKAKEEHLYLKPRFSPGYGDTSLELQKDFERLLKMSEIGIHLTESLLMVPSKSVTAFIGITDHPQKSVSGCKACDKLDCPSRKE
jgi:cobalamin-dependent methionine synthase I